ncbi:hypothetical protein K432DRAFT_430168 [Lepidopterella palustris CBS 459.81]|uniref:Peroxisomal membrane protein PEX14 n=1 Tax=Lepidopterella palustris CBS 459.81 TaxID=1314670 RepID=A0A8E2DYW6_9PEZI|nr:hypothetical protein K432DRAFT_430168 [Lepidopterella palustris CBS 459.81]
MSDKSSKPSIPSWQRPQSTTPASPPPPGPEDSTQQKEPTQVETGLERTSLLEQASNFLEDPTIRDAPRERKVAFLESKGVNMDDITKLLGAPKEQTSSLDLSNSGEKAFRKSRPTTASKPQPRDIPPIVTYPEFLTESSKPPPLVTARRILTTAYITGGLAATIYGLSKYVVTPMTNTLAEARHDFASHIQTQMDDLNNRLKNMVSTDPANTIKSTAIAKYADAVDDVSEADSDPTELYHRDFGTQTSPNFSRRPSIASSSTEASPPEENIVVTGHVTRLKILTSHIRELEATKSNDSASTNSLRTQLTDLTTYLNEMSYQNQYYGGGMGAMYGGSNYGTPKTKDGKDDQVEALKAEIRGVKGVLLSARNFPAGGGRVLGRVGG